jgi:hypothetical protein
MDQVQGLHTWIVSVTYVITAAQAEELRANRRVDLPDDFAVLGPICYYCEALYEAAPAQCPGDFAQLDADTSLEDAKEA